MSADNWTTCPRCELRRANEIERFNEVINRAYGSTPIEEFDRLRAVRDAKVAEQPESTVREDYEFWGINEGVFHVTYSARCTTCGFAHTFEHEETLEVTP